MPSSGSHVSEDRIPGRCTDTVPPPAWPTAGPEEPSPGHPSRREQSPRDRRAKQPTRTPQGRHPHVHCRRTNESSEFCRGHGVVRISRRPLGCPSSLPHPQLGQRPKRKHCPVTGRQLWCQSQTWHPGGDALCRDLQFQAGESGSEAEVNAVPEREMRGRPTAWTEPGRTCVGATVPAGRSVQQK